MAGESRRGSFLEVLAVFLRLGLTSFGGPVAHLGYFREEIVARRKWLNEAAYADLVALCQFLPGPASSQVGIALGLRRAGLPGGLAAWLGFTAPSAAALILFAYGVAFFGDVEGAGWLNGLKTAAVAVVALAVWGMARSLCPDRPRAAIAIAATVAMLAWPSGWGQLVVIGVAGIVGWRFLRAEQASAEREQQFPVSRWLAVGCLVIFGVLLVGMPVLRGALTAGTLLETVEVFDSFYRAGSLVCGGGHVVLPLLQELVVAPGWVTNAEFVAGYGAAQAVPGPLFTFSAYLGIFVGMPSGWAGGLFALAAIFLPSFMLGHRRGALLGQTAEVGQLWRGAAWHQRCGCGAAAGGALYDPVWTSAIHGPEDFGMALVALGLLAIWKWPPWLVVVMSAGVGQALTFVV